MKRSSSRRRPAALAVGVPAALAALLAAAGPAAAAPPAAPDVETTLGKLPDITSFVMNPVSGAPLLPTQLGLGGSQVQVSGKQLTFPVATWGDGKSSTGYLGPVSDLGRGNGFGGTWNVGGGDKDGLSFGLSTTAGAIKPILGKGGFVPQIGSVGTVSQSVFGGTGKVSLSTGNLLGGGNLLKKLGLGASIPIGEIGKVFGISGLPNLNLNLGIGGTGKISFGLGKGVAKAPETPMFGLAKDGFTLSTGNGVFSVPNDGGVFDPKSYGASLGGLSLGNLGSGTGGTPVSFGAPVSGGISVPGFGGGSLNLNKPSSTLLTAFGLPGSDLFLAG